MSNLTEEQVRLMRHALGLDRAKYSYRNRYIISETSRVAAEWRGLISMGFASVEPHLDSGMALYSVTPAGHAAVTSQDRGAT